MNQETTFVGNEQIAASTNGFSTRLANCIEGVGMIMVTTNAARALVPAPFRLAGEDDLVTPLVVLAVRGDIALAGQQPTTGVIAQVGLVIVPPDGTGDVNIFTCWYYTSHAGLARMMGSRGINAQHVPIDYRNVPHSASAPFNVAVRHAEKSFLSIDGNVFAPSERITFVANWWASSDSGSFKMTTSIPEAFVGEANLMLTTEPHSALGQLIGGGSVGFPVLQRFNTFAQARFSATPCEL